MRHELQSANDIAQASQRDNAANIASAISAQDMERYRQCVAAIGVPDKQKDEMISIVYSIMSYFVEQAFGGQTDQITLQSNSKTRFLKTHDHDKISGNSDRQVIEIMKGDGGDDFQHSEKHMR